jgi:hypothetical protein
MISFTNNGALPHCLRQLGNPKISQKTVALGIAVGIFHARS